jgi:hypothetical protein
MISVRTRRLLLWVALPALILVVLYTVLGFFLVPRLIRSGVHDFVTKNYHREVTLGDVRFNPYTLRLDVRDFSLPDDDGQPMLSFRHLLVDLTIASVWRLGPDFEAISLEQPFARVLVKRDGTLNLSELALPPSPTPKPVPKPQPTRLFINRFTVQGGNVAFEDLAHPSAFRTEIKPIAFDLEHFSTVGKEDGTYVLTGASEVGEKFTWSGSVSPAPLSSHGKFEVENLQARTIWSYIRDSVHFELPSGAISIAGDYDFTTATNPTGLAVNVHQVTLTDLGIRPQGTTEDYIKLTRLEIHETVADVPKHTVTVGGVRLDGGEVRAWMPGAQGAMLNLMEMVGQGATSSTPASAPTTEAPPVNTTSTPPAGTTATPPSDTSQTWVVSVPDIALENLRITAEDRHMTPSVAMRLTDLGIHVNGFTTARNTPITVALSTKINQSGKLDAKADVSPDLKAMKIQTDLAGFDLTVFQPYLSQKTAMTLKSGLLSTKLNAERGADGQLAVSGNVEVAKLDTVDNDLKRDFIKWDRVQVTGIDYQGNLSDTSKPSSLHVHNVLAYVPYARVIIEPDRTTNVKRVLRMRASDTAASSDNASAKGAATAAGAATAEATAESPDNHGAASPAAETNSSEANARRVTPRHGHSMHRGATVASATSPAKGTTTAIAVDAINIQNGSANYADLWIQPHFGIGIQALNGSVLGLSSDPQARAKVDLNGKVDRYAPIRIWGETNPLAATTYSDIKMSFKGVELSSVTPYSGRFAGYKIEKGKLSADIEYKLDNNNLNASHKFVVDQLQLGERVESPDAVKLPLKLAIALLKDRNGVINLDLPMTGSLDDPQFKLGPLIWKVFVNLLERAATAPFAALGHLFGGSHGEDLKYIDFRPGSAVLEASERDKLNTLVKALKEKEKLELDVPITYSPDLDRPGLTTAHLNARLLELKQGQAATGSKQGKGGLRTVAAGPAQMQPTAPAAAQSTPTPGLGDAPPPSAVMDAPPPTDPALTDPAQRFKLLVALYRRELGKSTPVPDSAKAAEDASKKKGQQPDFDTANGDLEAAVTQKMPVPDSELETLGKHRARAIQEVLLVGTDIDPARVFVIGTAPKAPEDSKDKVRVELSLK